MVYNGFELTCIKVGDDSLYEDPRSIEAYGFEAPTLTIKPAGLVASIQNNRGDHGPYVHLKINGEVVIPESVHTDDGHYLRTLSDWDEDDPLMRLPTCEDYQYDDKMASIR